MKQEISFLNSIESEEGRMVELATRWSEINTHTFHLSGIEKMSLLVSREFATLGAEAKSIPLNSSASVNDKGSIESFPLAPALSFRMRPLLEKQALLVCHMDTVFSKDDSFQKVERPNAEILKGPGVTDAKGGIVILFKALQAFEESPLAKKIGWEVLLNTDEEIGSPGSLPLLLERAKRNQIGFVFEPALSDGNLVGTRKGSGNFTLVTRGRAAHAGRDHVLGRNAIDAMAACITAIRNLNYKKPGLTINFGVVRGGAQVNVVPDLAVTQFNVRVRKPEDIKYVLNRTNHTIHLIERKHEVKIAIHGAFSAPPKLLEGKSLAIHQHVLETAKELGLSVNLKESGGVCDGNRLNAEGLPTVDSMGAVGERIHSHEECLKVQSLVERAKLTALCLAKWASGAWDKKN